MTEKKVSIIIVTFNALDYVKKCLASVLANTRPMHEIIVVDNASDPPTRDYLVNLATSQPIKLILNQTNRLWSPGCNDGLRAAAEDAPFCLLLNSDTEIFRPDWLAVMQAPMHQYANVFISGIQHNFLPLKPFYGAIDGCCFLMQKSLIDEIGYLTEEYPWNGAGFIFSAKAWSRGHYYYHIDNPSLMVHYGKRSRIASQTLLDNQKVDVFQIMKDFGLKPRYDYLSYILHHLKRFDLNKKLERYYQ